jgi:hypothetical protein
MSSAATLRARLESSLDERLYSTLLLRERTAPVTVPFGVAALDTLTGGLPRGALSEITGPASSGRTGVMMAALAAATRRQEVCALVDATDSFDPASAAAAGVDLNRLLWVRCNETVNALRPRGQRTDMAVGQRQSGYLLNAGFAFGGRLEQVLKVTDLLLQGGGFGMVVLDLGDVPVESARRVPLTSWFRFRRAVEPTATVLLLVENEPCAKTCASLVLRLQQQGINTSDSITLANGSGQTDLEFSFGAMGSSDFGNKTRSGTAVIGKNISQITDVPRGPETEEKSCSSRAAVTHALLLRGVSFRAEVVRSWAQRKAPHSVGAQFELCTTMG